MTPGFVDIHMHEDPVGADGKIACGIFDCMLRMGVTTGPEEIPAQPPSRAAWRDAFSLADCSGVMGAYLSRAPACSRK